MYCSVKDLLQMLIAIPSVNPQFAAADPAWVGEGNLTNFLQQIVAEQGWQWLRQPVHPGRDNLIALVPGSDNASQPVVMWEVHQDTVGISGMKIEPFGGSLDGHRICGRGACDVKGGMAAMIAALAEASQSGSLCATHLLAFTVNEECGFSGAKALASLWATDEQLHRLGELPPDLKSAPASGPLALAELSALRPTAVVVAEPTELAVVVAHKGIVRWRCHTQGLAAHSSQPQLGRNAIYAMTEVVDAIRSYDVEVLVPQGDEGLCGRPTVSVNTIQGGSGANVVPDHAVIDLDRRLLPREDPLQARAELIEYIASHIRAETQLAHELPWNQSRGLQATANRDWAANVAAAASWGGTPAEIVGVPYGTNAWVYAALGIPTVVFGPGSIAQAHTEDEWISLEQLERGVTAYRRIAEGVGKRTML